MKVFRFIGGLILAGILLVSILFTELYTLIVAACKFVTTRKMGHVLFFLLWLTFIIFVAGQLVRFLNQNYFAQ